MTKTQKIKIRNNALTDLFNSTELREKIKSLMFKFFIPLHADLESDILQVVFENLIKYDLDKFIEAYLDNPKRILALALSLAKRKGCYKDLRYGKGYNASIAQQILHTSTLNTLQHISPTICGNDKDEIFSNTYDHFNIILKNDDQGYYTLEEQIESDHIKDENEAFHINMWRNIRQNLTQQENKTLQLILDPRHVKIKGKLKKDYLQLLERIKTIITTWKQTSELN